MTSTDWIAPAMGLFATLWAWFRHRDTRLTDAERASLLEKLATDAAAVVLAAFPGKSWAELVNMIVQRLLAMPGVPTKNAAALEGAATSALARMKGLPGVSR